MTGDASTPGPVRKELVRDVLAGKTALVTGIANENSIAFGCARGFRDLGAEVAVTYLNDKAKPHVEPAAGLVDASLFLPLDVQKEGEMEAVFEAVERHWGKLDILVHAIAFAPKDDLHGRVVDCSREGFLKAMDISCYSFLRMAHLAEPLMKDGGTMFTMSFHGAEKVVNNYGVMGPVKAALESTTRYLAAELGEKGIRVHAISPGPLKTRAASGIKGFDELLDASAARAPARSLVSIDDVGITCAVLASDSMKLMTGGTLYIDGGLNIMG